MFFDARTVANATPVLTDGLSRHTKNLDFLRVRIERIYDVLLPATTFESLATLKQFTTGLLLPSSDHPWSRPIRRLNRRDRLSIAGSLFLFRKTLPASRPSLPAYVKKMTTPAPPPADGYLEFITNELNKMFPVGWDKGYESAVRGTCIRPSSCLENKSKDGGARMLAASHFESREAFVASCLQKYGGRTPTVSLSKAVIAPCAGKDRIVTVNSIDMALLSPYHTLLYDHISKENWCLRGEATTRCFRDFVARNGELLVSGDYESATDGLNQEVACHIMNRINVRCTTVPLHIRDGASRTLKPTISVDGRYYATEKGQLMGNSMSFPLLCLQNYLAFKFLIPREVPVRINGDDIVFRSTPQEYQTWKDGVLNCGLTLSPGKTMVDARCFSLNSTFFVAGTRHVREAPVIRSTALLSPLDARDGFTSLIGRLETFRSFGPHRRFELVVAFLGRYRAAVRCSQRSLTRGLGLRWLTRREIIAANLGEHESYYLSLPDRYDPSPDALPGFFRSSVPEGWRRVRKNTPVDQSVQKEFFRELVEHTWKPEKWDGTKRVAWTASFSSPFTSKFARRLLSGRKILARKIDFRIPRKKEGVMRWERDDERTCQPVSEEFEVPKGEVIKSSGFTIVKGYWETKFYQFDPTDIVFPASFHHL